MGSSADLPESVLAELRIIRDPGHRPARPVAGAALRAGGGGGRGTVTILTRKGKYTKTDRC